MDTVHALPAELTIYAVAAEHARLDALVRDGSFAGGAAVDASRVLEADGAGIQLLLSLRASLLAGGQALRLRAPSEALRAACAGLGAGDLVAEAA